MSAERVVTLAAQPPIFAERVRATVLAWRSGSAWFADTPLAPGPHSHPGATELFVVLEGAFEMTVGHERLTMSQGDVFLIPPDAVHEPLGNAGTDLSLVSIVSPNRKGSRFKTSDFPDWGYDLAPGRGSAIVREIPSNHQLDSELVILAADERSDWEGRADVDRVLLVLSGEVELRMPPLSGRLGAGSMTFVPAKAGHTVTGVGADPAVVLATWATGLEAPASDT
ncbi:MAG: hypothetical protein BGO11_19770 [Solirubrobacterales bacterium 70-9]|nr:MAG: hypothetical protein BGO11_19770 [Solirubrobacterales bacterium 70-9]